MENSSTEFSQPTISQDGRYENPKSFTTWRIPPASFTWSSVQTIWRWKINEQKPKIPNEEILQQTLPLHIPKFPLHSPLGATWLGHATMFVRINGISVITDPVWATHAAPFPLKFCRRYRRAPCDIDQLPEIDVGVISHNHYDHLDKKAVKHLAARFPEMHWFVPMGLAPWMRTVLGNGKNINQLDWGQNQTCILKDGRNVRVHSIPAQHWSQRTACDRNKTLWCGWLIETEQKKFYYTGDTGFCDEEFRKVGERFGPVDLCAIPIGCYAPRWLMGPQHIDIAEAVKIHLSTRARKSIGIHWGTYEMGSCEPYLEPRSKLREEVEAQGLKPDEFITLEHGQSWHL